MDKLRAYCSRTIGSLLRPWRRMAARFPSGPRLGIAARLVSARDGGVLWASSQSEAGRGWFSRDSVNNVSQRVAARMLDGLKDATDGQGD